MLIVEISVVGDFIQGVHSGEDGLTALHLELVVIWNREWNLQVNIRRCKCIFDLEFELGGCGCKWDQESRIRVFLR